MTRLLILILALIASGCGRDWAIVYRDARGLHAVSDENWGFREAKESAANLESKGYALKGTAVVLSREAALNLMRNH